MTKFEEALQKVQESIKNLMTEKDISDEKLEKLTELNAQVKELDQQHQGLVESYVKVRDKYIENITQTGSTKKPDEDDGSSQPRTFEQIASEVLAKK